MSITELYSDLLTREEAAEVLRTTPRHIERLCEVGDLAFYRVGRFIRFRREDLDAYLDRSHVNAKGS